MKKRNIYRNQSQEILSLFESAGDRDKIMCIPMDTSWCKQQCKKKYFYMI
jgi:hypothetical protein